MPSIDDGEEDTRDCIVGGMLYTSTHGAHSRVCAATCSDLLLPYKAVSHPIDKKCHVYHRLTDLCLPDPRALSLRPRPYDYHACKDYGAPGLKEKRSTMPENRHCGLRYLHGLRCPGIRAATANPMIGLSFIYLCRRLYHIVPATCPYPCASCTSLRLRCTCYFA